MELLEVFAFNLKRLRDEKKWSQATLAKEAKISMSAIQGYEYGRRWPEEPYFKALANALGVPFSALLQPVNSNEPQASGAQSRPQIETSKDHQAELMKMMIQMQNELSDLKNKVSAVDSKTEVREDPFIEYLKDSPIYLHLKIVLPFLNEQGIDKLDAALDMIFRLPKNRKSFPASEIQEAEHKLVQLKKQA